MSMNQCTFIGNLVQDPVTKDVGDTSVTNFSIAVNRKYKSGDKLKEEVNFLDMVAWDKGGESIAKFFKKGDPILLYCSARQETWTSSEGSPRSKIVFRVERFDFLPKNAGKKREAAEETVEEAPVPVGAGAAGTQDEIPF